MTSEHAASHEEQRTPPPRSTLEPLRMVLLGRTGTGRSSAGNTILGRAAFWVEASPSSVTSRCRRQSGAVGGRSLSVVDTPGFSHTDLPPGEVMEEVGQSVLLYPPGPHVFLLTLQLGRFTQEEREALGWVRARFGPQVFRFALVLFTWGGQLGGKSLEDFLGESPELSQLVGACQGGYHMLDNTSDDPQQVTQLLDKVHRLASKNTGGCYGNELYKEAERDVRAVRDRMLGEGGHSMEKGPKTDEEGRRAQRQFWCELVTAVGRGAAEGIAGKDGGGKARGKMKVVEKAAALAAAPLCVQSAARAVGGAVREGGKVLLKHKHTLLH